MAHRQKLKRSYRLSESGRARLRESVQKTRPWEKSTGPCTDEGKRIASRNALKHGLRSAKKIAEERAFKQAMRDSEKTLDLMVGLLQAPKGSDAYFDRLEELMQLAADEPADT